IPDVFGIFDDQTFVLGHLETELEKQYSPSRWSHRMAADDVIKAHVKALKEGLFFTLFTNVRRQDVLTKLWMFGTPSLHCSASWQNSLLRLSCKQIAGLLWPLLL
uniref:Uncharacterized protein n=1 Tax=Xiphophorus couchianus TaxID=32473 RepID=A0A3B5MHU3_9TELE